MLGSLDVPMGHSTYEATVFDCRTTGYHLLCPLPPCRSQNSITSDKKIASLWGLSWIYFAQLNVTSWSASLRYSHFKGFRSPYQGKVLSKGVHFSFLGRETAYSQQLVYQRLPRRDWEYVAAHCIYKKFITDLLSKDWKHVSACLSEILGT